MEERLTLERENKLEIAIARLDEQIKAVREDIRALKDGVDRRLTAVEKDKANYTDLVNIQNISLDHEKRLSEAESKISQYFITIGLYTLFNLGLAGLIVYHIFQ